MRKDLIGLDTETYRGRAVLVCTPTKMLEPRGFEQIIDFLKGGHYVCWNADYDVQAMIWFLSRERKADLSYHTRTTWASYQLRYVPRKYFKVWHDKRLFFVIYDLCQFYGRGLDKVAREVLGDRKLEIPEGWYQDMRACLRDERRQRVIDYCKHDAGLCQRIAEITGRRFRKARIDFARPVSCASLAVQVLGGAMVHRLPRRVNGRFRDVFRGGRIECLKVGHWNRAYVYDLRSAYPSAMRVLPACDGRFVREERVRDDAVYAVVRCHLAIPLGEYVSPVPLVLRGIDSIVYPVGCYRVDLDLETFRYCESQGWVVRVEDAIQMIGGSGGRPFGLLARLYRRRQANDDLNWAYKIVMNAAFGKLAETIVKRRRTGLVGPGAEWFGGGFWRSRECWTKRTNFLYAGAVTARIRLRLLREISAERVIFYATDGVIVDKPLRGLDRGAALGQWDYKGAVTDLTVVGSGVYTYRWMDTGERVTHFRGFDVDLDLASLLERNGYKIPLSVLRNVTLAQCRVGGNIWRRLNHLIECERVLDVRFDSKRVWQGRWQARDLLHKKFDSIPWGYYGAHQVREL